MTGRADQYQTTLVIDDVPYGEWDSKEGGNKTAPDTVYKAAGGRQVSLGGRPTTDTVTLSRLLEKATGDWDKMVDLHANKTGKAVCVASQRPLDEDGNPYGTPLVYRGKLIGVNPPSQNTNEDGESLWSVVIRPEG